MKMSADLHAIPVMSYLVVALDPAEVMGAGVVLKLYVKKVNMICTLSSIHMSY